MPKVNITYQCGHEGYEHRSGNRASRDSYAEWAGDNRLCSDCWRANFARERAVESAAAAEANASSGLPELEGSPKQIAWAEAIRAPVCAALRAVDLPIFEEGVDLPKHCRQELGDAQILIVDEVIGQASAKWWIDQRGRLPGSGDYEADYWVLSMIRRRGLIPQTEAALKERQAQVAS